MESKTFYHVVTEKPMRLNQIILFDSNHRNGVANRVIRVKEIMEQTEVYIDTLDDLDKLIYTNLKYWNNIADRELALEYIRKRDFPNYPSRMACLYVSKDLEDAKKWAEYFISIDRKTYQIVKLKNDGISFTGDAHNCWYECPSKDEAWKRACHYWSNKPNIKNKKPIFETIINGKIEVIEVVKDFRNKEY